MATKATVDTAALSSFELTSKATRGAASHLILAESLLRQDARYTALSRLSWQLVIPTAAKGVYLALKSDYSSSDL